MTGALVLPIPLSICAATVAVALSVVAAKHRRALDDAIRTTGSFDLDTRQWSADGWQVRATELVANAPACVSLILIQLRHPRDGLDIARRLGLSGFATFGTVETAIGRPRPDLVAVLSEVDLAAAGVLLARAIRDRLGQDGVHCFVGSAVRQGSDLAGLMRDATTDLVFRELTARVLEQ